MKCNKAKLARVLLGNASVALLVCATASGADLPESRYTATERHGLTYCVALSDTAFAVAERKLRGDTAGDLRAEYAARPRSELTLPLIDKVYADEFKSSWDYAGRFFDECAVNVVEIPAVRLAGADACLQQGMIASLAHSQKAGGATKDSVYAYFAKFPAESTHAVIDTVYAKDEKDRPAAELSAWNDCMKPLTRGE
jgi:hypothetical protein